jgi:hypothetical protein
MAIQTINSGPEMRTLTKKIRRNKRLKMQELISLEI